MAILYSDQYQDLHIDKPATRVGEDLAFGQVQMLRFTYTQSGAGNIGDVLYLRQVPPQCQILVPYCRFAFTAWAANTTLDVGHLAYTSQAGVAVVAAAAALIDEIDVDAAGEWTQGMLITAASVARFAPVVEVFEIRAQSPVILTATFRVAAPSDTDTLKGWIAVSII